MKKTVPQEPNRKRRLALDVAGLLAILVVVGTLVALSVTG